MNPAYPRSPTSTMPAVAMLVLATACWGFSFPLMRALMLEQKQAWPEASEWFLAALIMGARFGLAALLLGLVCVRRWGGLSRLEMKLGVGLGLFAGGGTIFQMVGLGHTLASTSAFLTQFYVLILPLIVIVSQKKLPAPLLVVCCLLVIVGMGVLCGIQWNHFQLGVGELETLMAAIIFVGNILWLDKREFVGTDKLRATVIMFATIAVMFLPMAFLTRPHVGNLSALYQLPSLWIMLAGLVLVCTMAPFTLMNQWQPLIPPTHAGIVYCAEPLFASFYALFLPTWLAQIGSFTYANEVLTMNLWIGGALITLANILIQRAPGTPLEKSSGQSAENKI